MSAASEARKAAKKTVKRLGNVKSPNKAQQRKLDAAEETVRTATIAIQAQKETAGKSLEELREMREESMADRAGLKGQAKFDEALQARAYADAMRAETGRQKGQGTPYVGPGGTIYMDEAGTGARLDESGRVMYDVDPREYERRFIPKFQPTEEQIARAGGPGGWARGLLSGEEAGYLTPWQQTNLQQLLDYGQYDDPDKKYILKPTEGPEGTTPTSRIPANLRADWRTNVWGGLLDPETGIWEIDDPQERAAAVATQLDRYNQGLFNPYTGQPVGGTGPEPWPGEGVTPPWGAPATGGGGGGGGPGTGSGSGGAYTPMAAQDWSGIMPQGVFAGSAVQPTQAMQGLVADQGLQYQPWAMPDNSVAGSPFVSQNVQYNAPLNYNPVVAPGGNGTTTDNGGDAAQDQLWWQQPGWDYSGTHGGTAGQPYWMAQGWASGLDWTSGQLTLDQQRAGWQNLMAGNAADPLGLTNQVADTTVNLGPTAGGLISRY